MLIWRQFLSASSATRHCFSCASCCLWERSMMSFAKPRFSSCLVNVHWTPVLLPAVGCLMMQSTTISKIVDDSKVYSGTSVSRWRLCQHCQTPSGWSTKSVYKGVCCSRDCSMMICIVAMWSVHDLSWRKPVCSSEVSYPERSSISLDDSCQCFSSGWRAA